jgi:hypothetical protein
MISKKGGSGFEELIGGAYGTPQRDRRTSCGKHRFYNGR